MSKFKVGDEVIHKGDKRIIKTIEKRNNVFVYTFIGNSLYWAYESDIFKTPHQELLDLGFSFWDNSNGLQYDRGDLQIMIDKETKTYKAYWLVDDMAFDVDLQLAKILVRYMEEL